MVSPSQLLPSLCQMLSVMIETPWLQLKRSGSQPKVLTLNRTPDALNYLKQRKWNSGSFSDFVVTKPFLLTS